MGFGINTPEQAAEIAAVADGVIVGSAIVKLAARYGGHAAPHRECTSENEGKHLVKIYSRQKQKRQSPRGFAFFWFTRSVFVLH